MSTSEEGRSSQCASSTTKSERGLRRPFCDQPQRREADQKEVGSVRLGDSERRLERAPLRVGKEIQAVEQWKQQLVKACEGELRLGQRTRRVTRP